MMQTAEISGISIIPNSQSGIAECLYHNHIQVIASPTWMDPSLITRVPISPCSRVDSFPMGVNLGIRLEFKRRAKSLRAFVSGDRRATIRKPGFSYRRLRCGKSAIAKRAKINAVGSGTELTGPTDKMPASNRHAASIPVAQVGSLSVR